MIPEALLMEAAKPVISSLVNNVITPRIQKFAEKVHIAKHSRVRNLCARGFKTLTEPIFNDEAYLVPVLLCTLCLKYTMISLFLGANVRII